MIDLLRCTFAQQERGHRRALPVREYVDGSYFLRGICLCDGDLCKSARLIGLFLCNNVLFCLVDLVYFYAPALFSEPDLHIYRYVYSACTLSSFSVAEYSFASIEM